MKVWVPAVLCSLVILSGGSDVSSEPVANSGIAFGLPFKCRTTAKRRVVRRPVAEKHEDASAVDATDNCKGLCLADEFGPGLSVTLVGKTGICRAKTGDMCSFNFYYGPVEVTQLVGSKRCLAVRDEESLFENERFYVAVVGVDSAAVREVSPNNDQSPLPKAAVLWARQILEASWARYPVSDPQTPPYRVVGPPQVARVKNVVLLKFEFVRESHGEAKAFLILVNNRLFRLDSHGCPGAYALFTVYDKLHIAFWDYCCGCGIVDKVVYDLSSAKPKLVYSNGAFAD